MHRTHSFLQFSMVSLFADYMGEAMNFCIEICFSQYVSLSNHQHIPVAMNTRGRVWFLLWSPSSIHGKLWETCLFVKHCRRHQKNMNLQHKHYLDDIIAFLYYLYTHSRIFTKMCMKTSVSCGVSCHHSTLIMKCNDLYALAAYST